MEEEDIGKGIMLIMFLIKIIWTLMKSIFPHP